ncbi:ThuA domain-containing protein [Metabacillus endolithicus]|uniref:ThuA domain-containing protein n=1 Tax=Metabacillus endolithicus TaxID=1535204 RepID=A0ABW5C4G0_9BACI|nr:ThuA domain-containing protein [Metabacillus endolithicus]UPG63921.1 ThuA domain-containing protein [Metabacillus endolithicus]
MKRIVALLGDYYHPKEWSTAALNMALSLLNKEEKLECKIIETSQIQEELSKKPDAVILFKEDRLNPTDENVETWMTEDVAEAIAQYVNQGGGWLAWHSGLASYSIESSYTKMLKGHFEYHPVKHAQVKYTSLEGNDLFGPVSFEILDEHYFVKVDEENTNVFLKSQSVDGNSIAGWSHHYGEGRVCCLTPAHNQEGLVHEEFIKILASTIEWVSGT